MCGIAGLIHPHQNSESLESIVNSMVTRLSHRGPDSSGVWIDGKAGVGIGHRRLSIIDFSHAGAQPMISQNKRFVIAFNGEIYNHTELRRELTNYDWRGHSDTETLLAAIQTWGVAETLNRLVGMFAFALWDQKLGLMTLARDRMGEKPLYYGWRGDVFLFGSELKALTAFSGWFGEVDRDSLTLFMRYGYIPAPRTIWKGINKLLPGSYVTISTRAHAGTKITPFFYWQAINAITKPPTVNIDDSSAIKLLDDQLHHAISGQMIADVPLGAFLSGGVDSSTIVAIMQMQSSIPVQTYSIGFDVSDYDEAIYANKVAKHLGTEHCELYLSSADIFSVVPKLADIYDEPFGDSSQIPTYLIASMARKEVAVCLSGDGGDELFGGYNRYLWGPKIWGILSKLPPTLRIILGQILSSIPPKNLDKLGSYLPAQFWQPMMGDRLHKMAGILDASSMSELYKRLVSLSLSPEGIVLGGSEPQTWAQANSNKFTDMFCEKLPVELMMFQDLISYLPDDVLVKVDRASMSVGLEVRTPFLDHQIVEHAINLPQHMKIRNGESKWLLRQVLYKYVPRSLIERPKQGFGVPLGDWLRGPLRGWAEDLLDKRKLSEQGFINPDLICLKWDEHVSGKRNWQNILWNVLMFQVWRQRWL